MKRTAVFPSVFGRLFADEHGGALGGTSLKNYRDDVLRDLKWLLNTSCHPTRSPVHHYPNVAASTLNFGTRDFVGVSDSSVQPEEIADAVREAIVRFEPRIAPETLSVTLIRDAYRDDFDSFALEITGDLWALPATEPLSLRTSWDVVGGVWNID